MSLARTFASRALAACGTLLFAAAGIAWMSAGFTLALGPVRISATDPARLAMEGAVALLAWAVITFERPGTRAASIVTAVLMAYYVALAAESSPRRVGDGHEYIAMARQLSRLRAPNLSQAELDAVRGEMAGVPGYGLTDLREDSLVGSDGRQDFRHFWVYPLLVAPVLAAVRGLGLHWNIAFTAVNLALLAGFAWCAAARLRPDVAVLLACSPVIWWIDKAHVEVFNYTLVGMALLLLETAPRIALLLLGCVTAQNPAFATILIPVAAVTLWSAERSDRRRIGAAAAAAVLVACVHPAYYLWRLGTTTPLSSTAAGEWPGITAVVTPLVDADLGLCWWFPALPLAMAIAASADIARERSRRLVAAVAVGAAALLVLVATSGNINHGATPGLSRYGVWLTPCALVIFLRSAQWTSWRRVAISVVALCSVAQIAWTSHPKLVENSVAPTSASIWLSDHAPRAYDPLPEVFAERYTGHDGQVWLPVASPECGKVLLSGLDRADVRWPIPCAPTPIPAACRHTRQLCYANRASGGYVFDRAPRQPRFDFIPEGAPELLWSGPADFDWLPVKIAWSRMSSVLPLGHTSPIRGARGISRIVAFQNSQDLVAFVTLAQPSFESPQVQLAPSGIGDQFWWLDPDRKVTASQQPLRAASWIDVPSPSARLLVVRRGHTGY